MVRYKCGWCRSSFKDATGLLEHTATKLADAFMVLKKVRLWLIRNDDVLEAKTMILAIDGALAEYDSTPFVSEHEEEVAKKHSLTIRRNGGPSLEG